MDGFAGVDVGYGYTKAVSFGDPKVSFPSIAVRAPEDSGLQEALGRVVPDHQVRFLSMPGGETESYLVGNDALAHGQRTFEDDAAKREDYETLVFAALRLLGVTGDLAVSVGLPLNLFRNQALREELSARLTGREAWVGVDGRSAAQIRIGALRVLPQAVGAFLPAAAADPALSRELVGVIDVGFRTTDFTVLRPGSQTPVVDSDRSGSVALGVGAIYASVAQALTAKYGTLNSAEGVEAAHERRTTYRLFGEEIPLGGLLDQAGRELGERLERELRRAWGEEWPRFGAVLVAGGGGEFLWKTLSTLHPVVRLLPEASFANAAGFALVAQSLSHRALV